MPLLVAALFELMLLVVMSSNAYALSLEDAVDKVLSTHPSIKSSQEAAKENDYLVSSVEWPKDPMFGVMFEKNMNFMQQEMGPMTSLGFMQEIEFPLKYIERGKIQRKRTEVLKEETRKEALRLRSKAISNYVKLYVAQKIKTLIHAQKSILGQMARIAESRHAVGGASQQDVMKAHVELTLMDNEYFTVQKEEEALKANLSYLLQDNNEVDVDPDQRLSIDLKLPDNLLENIASNAVELRQDQLILEEAVFRKNLAWYDFAPDFRLGAKMMVGDSAPAGNFSFSFEVSIPTWLLAKQSHGLNAARAQERQKTYQIEARRRDINAKAQTLVAEIQTHNRLINIFETTLIPQANSSFLSSQAAYQSENGSFMDLLESVRTIFSVKVSSLRHLAEFVEALTALEELSGVSLSNLPAKGLKS